MQIILILFLLNFSKNYYLLSDMKNFDIFIPGGYKNFKFSYPPGYENIKFSCPPGRGSKNFTTVIFLLYKMKTK